MKLGLLRAGASREIRAISLSVEPPIRELSIQAQPNDVTCGPTCLQAVYGFWGDDLEIETVISEVSQLSTRGTLAVLLGQHALKRGYRATLYTYNLEVFDPTWFEAPDRLHQRLALRHEARAGERMRFTIEAYQSYLELGGEVRFRPLDRILLDELLAEGPVLTGLSATYLYGTAREVDNGETIEFDDIRGDAAGHFVVLKGYDAGSDRVAVADPLQTNPLAGPGHHYSVPSELLMGAIMLGVVTYDGNLLVIQPSDPAGTS